MIKPVVGKLVSVMVDPRQNGGEDVATAMIVKVVDDEHVNLKVFLDSDENLWLQNVELIEKKPEDSDEDAEEEPEAPAGSYSTNVPRRGAFALARS